MALTIKVPGRILTLGKGGCSGSSAFAEHMDEYRFPSLWVDIDSSDKKLASITCSKKPVGLVIHS